LGEGGGDVSKVPPTGILINPQTGKANNNYISTANERAKDFLKKVDAKLTEIKKADPKIEDSLNDKLQASGGQPDQKFAASLTPQEKQYYSLLNAQAVVKEQRTGLRDRTFGYYLPADTPVIDLNTGKAKLDDKGQPVVLKAGQQADYKGIDPEKTVGGAAGNLGLVGTVGLGGLQFVQGINNLRGGDWASAIVNFVSGAQVPFQAGAGLNNPAFFDENGKARTLTGTVAKVAKKAGVDIDKVNGLTEGIETILDTVGLIAQ
jgi:hypothetical protein